MSKSNRSLSFFSLPEYQQWLESTGNNGKGYKIKYYKGLGTSTSAEAKEYFSSLDLHEVNFANLSLDVSIPYEETEAMDVDVGVAGTTPTSGSDLIDLVFKKDRVGDRKEWLNTFKKDTYLDYREVSEVGELKYSDFINKEYIIFSTYDNERSIPNIMDGFKPSQRKVLFSCFKRKLKTEIKVAQVRLPPVYLRFKLEVNIPSQRLMCSFSTFSSRDMLPNTRPIITGNSRCSKRSLVLPRPLSGQTTSICSPRRVSLVPVAWEARTPRRLVTSSHVWNQSLVPSSIRMTTIFSLT